MKAIKKSAQKSRLKASFDMLSGGRKVLLLIFLLLISFISLPVFLVLIIGMLPTITILATDSQNTGKIITVGAFNLAGVFIFLIRVLQDFTTDYAINILSDIFNLIIMYGAATIGFILYKEIPNFFVFIHKISAQKRLENIENKLTKLTEEWGKDTIENQINRISK